MAEYAAEPFTIGVTVRGYETDALGHLNQSVYLQYAEHARWSVLQAAGVNPSELLAKGVGPVVLETTIRYLRELRAGDEVEVTCAFEWGEGKTFRVAQTIRKADGTVSAEVASVGGLMDLEERRLVADPQGYFRALAGEPKVFGL
ncbi:acyl-CoA thioesterase [Streptomyces chiangmaiensis]|uniref:Acyl-CoA thioesterase n=1 Tax=Streptomyces chiangmaiensis TaxID=766497 RepID=A0ABU7F9N3_9ACTN|nr:acyl-CoA thioesterase [Streptomyces chiangmaiensis]MED7820783.1 acyl-CoA thioesterase [Streptomyces chiangmaiensis]